MLAWMKPYQHRRNLTLRRGVGTVDFRLRQQKEIYEIKVVSVLYVTIAIAASLGCSDRSKAPVVANDIRHALDEGGLNDVSVSQDRDKGVVTLGGKVRTGDDKARAESIAKSIVGNEVVSNEIGVRPNGDEGTAKKVDSRSRRHR